MITKTSRKKTSRKEWMWRIALLAALLAMLLTVPQALAFGIAPSREIFAYSPGSHSFTVRILNPELSERDVAIYASGELSQYAQVLTPLIHIPAGQGEAEARYSINLPESGLQPGERNLDVLAVELPPATARRGEQSQVSVGLLVTHQLKVQVPYPGQYAEGSFFVSDTQAGQPVSFTVALYNKGKEQLSASADVIIKGPTNEQLNRLPLSSAKIPVNGQAKLEGSWQHNLNSGEYIAEAIVTYGDKTIVLRKTFYVGNKYVEIKDISVKEFKLGSIARLDVSVESKWNQPLDSVYAEMYVLDSAGGTLSTFKTGSTTLNSYAMGAISGYWDTEGISPGTYDIRFVLYYSGKQSEKIFRVNVGLDSIIVQEYGTSGQVVGGKSGAGGPISILTVLVIILIGINVSWFVYFKVSRKAKGGEQQ